VANTSGGQELAEHLAEMARELQAPDTLDETLDAIVRCAVANIPRAEHASISTVTQRRHVRTLVSTGDILRAVDRAQYDLGQGPCVETLYEHKTVRAPDLASEQRWPEFAKRATELGAGSMLGVQLYVAGDDLGALNLINGSRDAFDEEAEEMALLFAAHAAIALADAEKRDNLNSALSSRDVIGQAKGILMERHKVTSDQAFRLLVQASQRRQEKLRDVAEQLTLTGELPGAQQADHLAAAGS
jgi:transcriptional regulator with GAF, ATPase, and Fis domain